MEPFPPPIRHPVPIPWGRWARIWAGPGLAVGGLLAYAALGLFTTTRCGGGNETSAISTLRNVWSCQNQFQHGAFVDEDGDGIGEFGGFLETSAAVAPRGRDAPMQVPLQSGAFRRLGPDGSVSRSGYRFRMFLIGRDGTALGEVPRIGFDEGEIDPDASEERWICYAWPASYGASGNRTFVVTEAGDIFGTDCASYSGPSGPSPGAALLPGPATAAPAAGAPCCSDDLDPLDLLDAPLADGVPARDGNVWRQIN